MTQVGGGLPRVERHQVRAPPGRCGLQPGDEPGMRGERRQIGKMLLDLFGQSVRHAARQPARIGPGERGAFAALPAQDGAMGIGRPGFRAGEERRAELRRLRAERQRGPDAAPVDDAAGRDHRCLHPIGDHGRQSEGAHERFLRPGEEGGAVAAGLEPGREDQVDAGLVDGARLGQRGRGADRCDLSSPALGQDRGGGDAEDEAEDRRPCLEQGLDLLVEARVIVCRRLGPAEAQLAEPGLEHRPGALELSPARLPATGIVVRDPKVQGERSRRCGGGARPRAARSRPAPGYGRHRSRGRPGSRRLQSARASRARRRTAPG